MLGDAPVDDSGGLYQGGYAAQGGGGWGGFSFDGSAPSHANTNILLNVERYADARDWNPYVVGSAAWTTAHGLPPALPSSERSFGQQSSGVIATPISGSGPAPISSSTPAQASAASWLLPVLIIGIAIVLSK